MTPRSLAVEDLIHQLEMRRSTADQRRFLAHWLKGLPSKILAPCLGLLLGRPLGATVTVPALKTALFCRVNKDLFDASKEAGSDLSETLALLWPGGNEPLDLADLVAAVRTGPKDERLDTVAALLDKSNALARDLVMRVSTGRFKSPVSPDLLRSTLAEVFSRPVADIEQNLANSEETLDPFSSWLFGVPFPETLAEQTGFLSLPTIQACEPDATGGANLCIALPSGSYAQLVSNPDSCHLYTLAGDRLEGPENYEELPPKTTLLIFLPKNPAAQPLLLDILIKDGEDLRNLPRQQRLGALEELAAAGALSGFARTEVEPLPAAASLGATFDNPSIDRLFLLHAAGTLDPSSDTLGEVLRPPHELYFKILYAEGTLSRQGIFAGVVTLGAPATTSKQGNYAELVPVGKASLHRLSQKDKSTLETYIAENTLERFGPVRKLAATEDTSLIARVICRSIDRASRRKAGLVLKEANVMELFDNSAAYRVSSLDELAPLALW